jgi:hypothetical protein
MARFTYSCREHGSFTLQLEKRERSRPCPSCGADSRAVLKSGTMQMVERLDNGVMPRAVERLHNIEEIMDEREKKFKQVDPDEDSES